MSKKSNWPLVAAAALAFAAPPAGAQEGGIRRAADAPPPRAPEESLGLFRSSPGFRVELVASEPLLSDPVAMTFDADGRIFVCELHGYNLEGHLDVLELNRTGILDREVRRIPASPEALRRAEEETYGTVKVLQDLDGDGRMDRAAVWADRLPPCYGVVEARRGVIVACAPEVIYLADEDGDGKAEVRETLLSGFGAGELWTRINNPLWSLDGWITFAPGHGSGGTIRGPRLASEVRLESTCFRLKPDGSAVEPASGGTSGFGQAVNDWGDRFLITNSQPLLHVIPLEHRYLARNPYHPAPGLVQSAADYDRTFPSSQPDPWRLERSRQPEWVRFYGAKEAAASGYFTASCAPVIYEAEAFPPEYRGNHFSCDSAQNLIHRSVLQREGAGYRGRRAPEEEGREFLTSTEQWFRPVNLAVGPDGALYIVDMYREIIEDYSAIPRYLQQQYGLIEGHDRGRIWRVVHEGAPRPRRPRLSDASTADLVAELEGGNAWWRRTAQRLLLERGDWTAVEPLAALCLGGRSPQARLHALATLGGLGELQASLVESALGDPHFAVRRHALGLAEKWIDERPGLLEKAAGMADDADAAVRLQLALTLGESRGDRALDALARLAAVHGGERWMAAAIASSAASRTGSLIDAIARIGPSAGSVAVLGPLASTAGARGDVGEIARALAAVAGLEGEAAAPLQLACLKGLREGLKRGRASGVSSPAARDALLRLLSRPGADVRLLALELGAAFGLGDSPELREAYALAGRQVLDPGLPLADRQAALALLASAPYEVIEPAARKLLAPQEPLELQLAAVGALSSAGDPRAAPALLERWGAYSPKVRSAALEALFARQDRLPALLEAIREGVVDPSSLDGFHRALLLENPDPGISAGALAVLPAGAAGIRPEILAGYRAALSGPRDPRRGEAVFKERCSGCHRVRNEGNAVGPDLSAANNRPDEAWLLDVLDPSGRIEAGFAAYAVMTAAGEVVTGILAAETATSVTLRREGGIEEAVLRRDIRRMAASGQSLMPDNLEEVIGPEDLASVLAYLREALGPPPPARIVLFDEEPGFAGLLNEGSGAAFLAEDESFSGRASLVVIPPQRYSDRLPGWSFPIVERPGPGEFRYLRWAWRAKGEGAMIELAAGGAWPAPDSPARRYYAGKNTTSWRARQVAERAPGEWTVVTADLWKDCGAFTLTGIAPTAMGGEARFDRIELLRSLEE